MSGSHRIRLQSAWDVAADGTAWVRSFGRPAGVGADDRLWLVIERPAGCGAVLNGRRLPPVVAGTAAWRHDVTADLRTRNELRLECSGATLPPGSGRLPLPESLGMVALEIESHG